MKVNVVRMIFPILSLSLFATTLTGAAILRKREVTNSDFYVWNVEHFPNPQVDFHMCNRTAPSFVCNPNNLLDEKDAQKLDFIISKIKNETVCACPECSPAPGITIGVAVFQNMFHDYHANLKEVANEFAKSLLTSWKLGTCGDAILIMLVIGNKQFEVVTGDAVSKVLSPSDLQDIESAILGYFKTNEIYQGLESMLVSISDKLAKVQHSPGFPNRDDDTNQSGVGLTVGLTVGFIALAAIFAAGIVLMRRKRAAFMEQKEAQRNSTKGSPIVRTPVVFSDAVYQPCSVEDPAGNYGHRAASDEELNFNEYSAPMKQRPDVHDSLKRELSSVEEKDNEDDNSSRDDNIEFRHPRLRKEH